MGKLTLGKYMIEILCTFQNVNRVKSETVRRGGGALSGGSTLSGSGIECSSRLVLS